MKYGLPWWLSNKESFCQAENQSLTQEDPLEKEMATPSRYSCLGNPMDRGAWQGTVHGVAKEPDTT